MEADQIERIVEAALLAADEPVSIDRLIKLFAPGELPDENSRGALRAALDAIGEATADRGFELVRVASGFASRYGSNLARGSLAFTKNVRRVIPAHCSRRWH